MLDLYYVYGFLLLETQQYDKAEKYLKKALKINPVSARIILELSEIYKMHTPDFNKFYMYTMEALTYSYYPQDIARCYRNLAHYYVEEDQLDVAVALLKYSMNFEMSITAYNELQYIESKGHDTSLSFDEIIPILESKNIQVGANPFILETVEELAKEYENNNLYNQSAYFYEILYNITSDEDIGKKLENITAKIKY